MSGRWKPLHARKRENRRTPFSWSELRVTLIGGIFLGLAAVTAAEQTGASGGAVEVSAATQSVRVIDGDTFDYGRIRVRIADIDTPELEARCPEEAALAQAATRRLRALLAAGPFELHSAGRDEDSYGRKLRIVTRGGRSIGDQLVAEGLARTWSGRRRPWC